MKSYKLQLLINELSLAIATLFLIISCISELPYTPWLIVVSLIMIGYSSTKTLKLKNLTKI